MTLRWTSWQKSHWRSWTWLSGFSSWSSSYSLSTIRLSLRWVFTFKTSQWKQTVNIKLFLLCGVKSDVDIQIHIFQVKHDLGHKWDVEQRHAGLNTSNISRLKTWTTQLSVEEEETTDICDFILKVSFQIIFLNYWIAYIIWSRSFAAQALSRTLY